MHCMFTWMFYSGVQSHEVNNARNIRDPELRRYIQGLSIKDLREGPINCFNVFIGLPEGTPEETYREVISSLQAKVQQLRPDIPEPRFVRLRHYPLPEGVERAKSLDLEELATLFTDQLDRLWDEVKPLLREAGRPV